MKTAQKVWISEQAHHRLRAELAELQALPPGDVTDSADQNLVAIQHARRSASSRSTIC